ncbi:MAG: alanine racemase [Parvibaculum sp.]|nr:alanine racemase [Parvibaculum sp.]
MTVFPPLASADLAAHDALLTIDLDALAVNYGRYRALAVGADVAGVVKANAYGLGLAPVARALAREGCRTFFVANVHEGEKLRAALPGTTIYTLNGLTEEAAKICARFDLRPCLGSLRDVDILAHLAKSLSRTLPAALHFDTGLSRLGFDRTETAKLIADKTLLNGIDVSLVMSHLARSDEPDEALNGLQLSRFKAIRAAFPDVPASLANSAGVLLARDYAFDLVRPGFAIYGGTPVDGRVSPVLPVLKAEARVLHIRDIEAGDSAGYNSTWTAKAPARLAILAVGYADGYPRVLSSDKNAGRVWLGGHYAPVAGRVSMDLLIVDVSHIPVGAFQCGDMAELIGPHVTLDEMAAKAKTNGYEVLTRLGERYKRHYTGKAATAES